MSNTTTPKVIYCIEGIAYNFYEKYYEQLEGKVIEELETTLDYFLTKNKAQEILYTEANINLINKMNKLDDIEMHEAYWAITGKNQFINLEEMINASKDYYIGNYDSDQECLQEAGYGANLDPLVTKRIDWKGLASDLNIYNCNTYYFSS